MPEPLLTLEGVTLLSPEGLPVFQALDWRLEAGARFHLQGGQGNGASAFLRLCCGIARPETGTVLLEGAPLASATGRHAFLDRGALGYVPSDGGLAVNLSLLDNVALPLRFALNQGRAEAQACAEHWLDQAGLLALARQRPHVPGDGQSWLASLARAAAKQPRLWLVDRPAGGLDARSLRAALGLLEQVGQDPGVTMVLVGEDWMGALGRPLSLEDGRVRGES
jgi:ABC-type ATPase involved in cell division